MAARQVVETQEKCAAESAAAAAAAAAKAATAVAETAIQRQQQQQRQQLGSAPAPGLALASGTAAAPLAKPGTIPKIQVAAEASKQEGEFAEALREARARVAAYTTTDAAKKERRQINNHITVHVQQIAATKRQIDQKAADIAHFLTGIPDDPQRTFAIISLAKRILTQ